MAAENKLKEEQIKAALQSHKGKDAHLISWSTGSFTADSDNYSSTILNVKLTFQKHDVKHEASYVAKLSQETTDELELETAHVEFTKDVGFYQEILPRISNILREGGLEELRVPRCFLTSLDKGTEMLILEDLRERMFQMHDRKTGLDVAHTTLVLKEVAKLHATTYLLQLKDFKVDLRDVYPDLMTIDRCSRRFFNKVMLVAFENTLRVLRKVAGYERGVKWLENNKDKCLDILYGHLCDRSPFDVICQGDCWNNNFLFRYNEDNNPVEVMLLDFQDLHKGSLATELNELLYTSLDGQTRKNHLDSFLITYHEAFERVLASCGAPMPFNIEELREEYKKRLEVGLLLGILTVPWMVCGDEGLQWYEGSPDDKGQLESFRSEMEAKTLQMLDSDPLLKQRFLSIIDDMIEAGVM